MRSHPGMRERSSSVEAMNPTGSAIATAISETTRLVVIASVTRASSKIRRKLTERELEVLIVPLQNGDSDDDDEGADRKRGRQRAIRATRAAAASFDGRDCIRNALPPWVMNRRMSPSENRWKITTVRPSIISGDPIAAATE